MTFYDEASDVFKKLAVGGAVQATAASAAATGAAMEAGAYTRSLLSST